MLKEYAHSTSLVEMITSAGYSHSGFMILLREKSRAEIQRMQDKVQKIVQRNFYTTIWIRDNQKTEAYCRKRNL